MKTSVLLLTYNEQSNLPRCLEALGWCDDIVIVDSGSTDATISIAKNAGARILTRPFDNFAAQRNFGLDHGAFKHEYVLHLDADEVATPEFVTALQALQPQDGIDGWNVPSKTMLLGQWLRYAGMYPTYQVRLGHRDRLRFVQVGHGQREDLAPERVGIFDVPYLHFNFSHGMKAWLTKHVTYASDEADFIIEARAAGPAQGALPKATQGRRKAKEKAAKIPLFLRPVARFFYVYFWRQGFRDGYAGLAYSIMMSVYEGMIAVMAFERIRSSGGDSK